MASNSASVMRPRRRRPSSWSIWAGIDQSSGPGGPPRGALPAGPIHLTGDRLLDPGRPGQVGKHLLAFTSGRLEQHVAGPDHPFEETLVVADVGQGRQRDLPDAPRQHPGPSDESTGGHHQPGGGPSGVAPEQPYRRQHQSTRLPTQSTQEGTDSTAAVTAAGDHRQKHHGRAGEVPPMRAHVDDHLLTVVQEPDRERHSVQGRPTARSVRRQRRRAGSLTRGPGSGHTPGFERRPVAAPAGWFGGIIRQARSRSLLRPGPDWPGTAIARPAPGDPPARHTLFVSSLKCERTMEASRSCWRA